MSNEKLINHWVEGSDKNFEDMLAIYNAERYDWALYIGHLVLEKLFKALYVKTTEKESAPIIHSLTRLASLCDIKLNEEQSRKLTIINTFNMETKYETQKKEFYTLCTKEYAGEQIKIIKEFQEWLKEKLAQE